MRSSRRPRSTGFFEATLCAAFPVAIESYAGGLFEQLAPLVGAVRKKRVDHLRFDHYSRIGTESGPSNHVVNVAQTAGTVIQEVLAFS